MQKLTKGEVYTFVIEDFETPFGEKVKVEPKTRKYLGKTNRAARGMPKEWFFKVQNIATNNIHLIYESSVVEIIKE